jgi:hypothetical protein
MGLAMNDRTKNAGITERRPGVYLTYGNAPRRFRPLDRELTLIGNAPACDIGMDGVGVFPVHCVIIRGSDGFYVRNCAGRASTRLNGAGIQESQLHDADLLQVGPFVLEMHLPLAGNVEDSIIVVDEIKLRHIQRSRRHLGQLALSLRQRLHAERTFGPNDQVKRDLTKRQAELNLQAESLRNQMYDSEQCVRRMDQAEQKLVADREALNRERAALQERVLQTEKDLERRREALEAEVWEEQVRQGEEAERQLARERELLKQERAAVQEHRLNNEQSRQQLTAERDAFQKEQVTLREQARNRQLADSQSTRERELLKQDRIALLARLKQVEQAEQQAEALIESFEREKASWQKRIDQIQEELENRQRVQESELRAREVECQRLMEQAKQARPVPAAADQATDAAVAREETWRLAIRQRELVHYARYLKRIRQRLEATTLPTTQPAPDIERQLNARRQELQQQERHVAEQVAKLQQERDVLNLDVQELEHGRQQWTSQREQSERQQTQEAAQLARQRQELEQEEAALRDKHLELVQTMSELKEMHQRLVAEHRSEQETLQGENVQLKQQLAERDQVLHELAGGPAGSGENLEEMRRELVELGKQLEQKDTLISALRGETSVSLLPPSTGDAVGYEIELNLFRRQLETDRVALNAEIRQIQARRGELDDDIRQAELELSRERATLARERAWVERLRDEVRIELERIRREGDLRERLEPYLRLAESERQRLGTGSAPHANKTAGKLTGLLNLLSQPLQKNE